MRELVPGEAIKTDGKCLRPCAPPLFTWPRVAELAGTVIVIVTCIIRLVSAEEDFFEQGGQPLLMLIVLLVPAVAMLVHRPFTLEGITVQQRYLLAALNFTAFVIWWIAFGEEWTESWGAEWTSRFTWFGVIVLPAIGTYFWLGWCNPPVDNSVKGNNGEE